MFEDASQLQRLTDQQWAEIRQIAAELWEAQFFERNQFKIAILAFQLWALEQEDTKHSSMENSHFH